MTPSHKIPKPRAESLFQYFKDNNITLEFITRVETFFIDAGFITVSQFNSLQTIQQRHQHTTAILNHRHLSIQPEYFIFDYTSD